MVTDRYRLLPNRWTNRWVLHQMIKASALLQDKRFKLTVFEISFKASQIFGLTGSEISQSKPKLVRPKTFFTIARVLTSKIKPTTQIRCQTICLTNFQISQTKATLASHYLTDWPYFEHWLITRSLTLKAKKRKQKMNSGKHQKVASHIHA